MSSRGYQPPQRPYSSECTISQRLENAEELHRFPTPLGPQGQMYFTLRVLRFFCVMLLCKQPEYQIRIQFRCLSTQNIT